MQRKKTKQEIIKPFKEGRDRILYLANDLLESEAEKSTLDNGWSIKDMFSHLCFWEWWKISAIDQILIGILPPYFDDNDDDYVNEREIFLRRNRSWTTILSEFKLASEAFLKKIESLKEEDFYYWSGIKWKNDDVTIAWLLRYVHYDEHANQLKQWRGENL